MNLRLAEGSGDAEDNDSLAEGYNDDSSPDYVPDHIGPNMGSELSIEYFMTFRITTENSTTWAANLKRVSHLWYLICVHWYQIIALFFGKELLHVSGSGNYFKPIGLC
jgi:hypothetical protein